MRCAYVGAVDRGADPICGALGLFPAAPAGAHGATAGSREAVIAAAISRECATRAHRLQLVRAGVRFRVTFAARRALANGETALAAGAVEARTIEAIFFGNAGIAQSTTSPCAGPAVAELTLITFVIGRALLAEAAFVAAIGESRHATLVNTVEALVATPVAAKRLAKTGNANLPFAASVVVAVGRIEKADAGYVVVR